VESTAFYFIPLAGMGRGILFMVCLMFLEELSERVLQRLQGGRGLLDTRPVQDSVAPGREFFQLLDPLLKVPPEYLSILDQAEGQGQTKQEWG